MKQTEAAENKAPAYEQVYDGRNRRVEGLWRRGKTFYAQLRVFDPDKGKRIPRRIRLTAASTTGAREEMEKLKQDRVKGELVSRRAPKFAEYVHETFWPLYAVKKARETIIKRELQLDMLVKAFGDSRLSDITTQAINKFRIMRLEKVCGGTVNGDMEFLTLIFKQAKKDGVIAHNPCDRVDRLEHTPAEKRLWTLAEIRAAADAAKGLLKKSGQAVHDYILLMAFSGVRRNEALQLKWDHVDFDGGKLNVGVDFKTKGGEKKYIDLNAELEAHLRDMHSRRQPDSVWLFPSATRGVLDRHTVSYAQSFVELNKLLEEPITPHVMRHFFVSFCVMSGIDFMTIAKWVGHKDGGVLIGKTYGHLAPSHTAQQARRIRFEPVVMERAAS